MSCPASLYEFPRGKRGTIAPSVPIAALAPAVRLTAPGSVCVCFSAANKGPGDTCNHGSLELAARSRLDNHSGDNDATLIDAQDSRVEGRAGKWTRPVALLQEAPRHVPVTVTRDSSRSSDNGCPYRRNGSRNDGGFENYVNGIGRLAARSVRSEAVTTAA